MENIIINRNNPDDIVDKLNYKKIIIHVDEECLLEFKNVIEEQMISHTSRINEYHNYYYIENCDVDSIDDLEGLIGLMADEKFVVYNSNFTDECMELIPTYRIFDITSDEYSANNKMHPPMRKRMYYDMGDCSYYCPICNVLLYDQFGGGSYNINQFVFDLKDAKFCPNCGLEFTNKDV